MFKRFLACVAVSLLLVLLSVPIFADFTDSNYLNIGPDSFTLYDDLGLHNVDPDDQYNSDAGDIYLCLDQGTWLVTLAGPSFLPGITFYHLDDGGDERFLVYSSSVSLQVVNLTRSEHPDDTVQISVQFLDPSNILPINPGSYYDSGYSFGYNDAANYFGPQLEQLQEQYRQLLDQMPDVGAIIDQTARENYEQGLADSAAASTFIQDSINTTFAGVGSVFNTMFNLEILGIKVYQVVILACIIPLALFILKFVKG